MGKREIIYQSEHLTVVHSEQGSETIVASFNEVGLLPKEDRFWGDDLFDRVGVSAIGFVSAQSWYPMIDMIPAIDAARARIAGRRLFTYGHSQGGYGALKFGAQLSASFALGFSPQWSINPDDVASFDRRFIKHYNEQLQNGKRIAAEDLCPLNFIFLDHTDRPDGENAARLLALGRVVRVAAPFTGHATVRLIAEGGQGRALIQRCIEEPAPTAAELRGMLRSCRARSAVYANEKIKHLSRTEGRHGRFLEAALRKLPDGPAKAMLMIARDVAKNNLDAARAALDSLTDEDILSVDFREHWTAFRNGGFVHGEARIGPLYRLRYKEDVFQRLHGVNSLIRSGATDLALEELDQLTKLPDAPQFISFFMQFYRQLGRLDLAAAFIETLAGDDPAYKPQRITMGFQLAAAYQGQNERSLLFRELQKLSDLCRDDIASMIRVVEMYISISEFAFARQALEKADVPDTHRNLVDAIVAQLTFRSDPDAAEAEVWRLRAVRSDDPQFWTKLSFVAEAVLGRDAAVEPIRRALALSPADPSLLLHRLADILISTGNKADGVKVLRQLLDTGMAATQRAHPFASLAVRCGRPDLALAFTSKWMAAAPSSGDACMVHLSFAIVAQKDASAALESVLDKLRSGQITLTREQHAKLIDTARGVGFASERRAFQLAVTAYPKDPEFIAATSQSEFAQKFFAPAGWSGQPSAKPRRGLLGLLGGMRRA